MKLNQCGKIHLLACKLVIFTKLANEHHSNCHERNFLGTSVTRRTRWKQTASSMVFFNFLKFTLSYIIQASRVCPQLDSQSHRDVGVEFVGT